MQKYVNQLIEDIKGAVEHIPPPLNEALIDKERYPIPYLYEWENAPEQKMSDMFQLEKIQFPPASRLTNAQMEQIIDAILELWEAYNFGWSIPNDIPIPRIYELLVNELDENHQYLSHGGAVIDFCCYWPEGCALKEYCQCIEIWMEDYEGEFAAFEATPEHKKQDFLSDFWKRAAKIDEERQKAEENNPANEDIEEWENPF